MKLDNPTVGQLLKSIHCLCEWLQVNQDDPEYTSFQLNFCFSGHGNIKRGGPARLVFADEELNVRDLVSLLLLCIPAQEEKPQGSRIDLYLDCCHSTAIAHGIAKSIVDMQGGADPSRHSVLNIGQLYCACLDDEEAYELRDLPHSLFTFAFLNECSRKRPEGASTTNLGLRDIGWYTNSLQHPMLVDFTVPEGWAMKFPSHYWITHPPGSTNVTNPSPAVDVVRLAMDPVEESIRLAREMRAQCKDVEQRLWKDETLRTPFSRDELLTNKRFPFL